MQKLYIKYKEKWWIAGLSFLLTILISWALERGLDYFFKTPNANIVYIVGKIMSFLYIKIPIFYLLTLFLSFGIVFAVYRLIQKNRIGRRRLIILKATYGKDHTQIEITRELNNLVINNTLNVVLSNNIAGDPCYGIPKIGKVKYQYDSQILEKEYLEGATIVLPEPPF